MIPKKPVPDLIRDGYRFSEKIMPKLAPILRAPLARADHHRAIALVAEADASALQIVRRHFHDHPVADAGADAEFAHLARPVGKDLLVVFEPPPEIAVRH